MGTGALQFTVVAEERGSPARCGVLRTPHGDVSTPAFMPVGTQATVKALTPRQLREAGAQMILGNAYHLSLRPGLDATARRHARNAHDRRRTDLL